MTRDGWKVIRILAILSLAAFLAGCMTPQPFTMKERYKEARQTLYSLNACQPPAARHIDYYEALARSVKYNLDYRLKIANIALQAGQLDVAVFTMYPSLNAIGSLYTRSNDYQVAGITAEGVQTGLSSSTPRTLRTARIAMSWNVLDFAMGYVKAKQQADRVLIAQEESRKQLQQLGQDVLVAYWVAYSAQQLLKQTKEFSDLLRRSRHTLNVALHDKLVPKENILNYQAAILEGDRKLIQVKYKYDKAMLDLKHLLFLPADQPIVLARPPRNLFHIQNLYSINMEKVDAVTLVNHPELQGQNYQQRLVRFGLKTVVLQSLPGLTFNDGWNYDSNKFLLNNRWMDKSMDVAWNLLNIASLPASYKTAKMQVQYENIKAMAMTIAALTQTRYAFSRYYTLTNEYKIAHQQTLNAKAMYKLNKDRKAAYFASSQQVIMAKLKYITSQMDEDLLRSDLSVAIGQMYLSVGVDLIPEEILYKPLPVAIDILRNRSPQQNNFIAYIDKKYHEIFRCPIVYVKPTYTVELCNSKNRKEMKSLYKKYSKDNVRFSKRTCRYGKCYVLTYGKYDTFDHAVSHSRQMPHVFAQFSPRVRRLDAMTLIS